MSTSILYSEKAIQEKVEELGKKLTEKFQGKDLVAICVLNGAFVFFADLIREIDMDIRCDFLKASSYVGTQSKGEITLKLDCHTPLKGAHVLIVDDILDTGFTLKYLVEKVKLHNPASVTTAVLLDKKASRKVDIKADYSCFDCPSTFVIGYGLDFDERYRHIPHVAQLEDIN